MTANIALALSRSNTGITDSSGNDTKGDSTSRASTSLSHTPRSSEKSGHLRNVAKLVQWAVKARDAKSTPRLWPSKSQIDTIQNQDRLNMRRGTVAAVGRPSGGSRVVTKPPRKSFGNVFKDAVEKGKSSPMNMLNIMAIREGIKKRKLMKKLRFCIRLQMLLGRWWKEHKLTEVSQTHPFYMQYQMINDLTENTPDSAVDFKASYFKANKQMRMSQEAVRILTLPSEDRTKEEVYYAMIALRGIDSIADYPLRMQQALAQHGMFQSFGPKRVIVKQTHPPCYFYFILYGTVVVATLDPGEPYAKTRVALRTGENFGSDELAIAHRSARQSTVLTMEYTEFLTIDCDTYENIFMAGGVKTINDPDHNKFMKSLFFLKEIPLEKLNSNPKAMEFCYFRRNSVMVKNSNNSDWIYIVKSGSLKVFKKLQRCYPRVNRRTGNYHSRAHTDGYHSFMCQHSEFNRYAMYNNLDLPSPLSPESDSEDEYDLHLDKTIEEKENLLSLPLLQRVERLIRPRTASGVISTYGQSSMQSSGKRNLRSAKSDSSKSRRVTPAPPLLVVNKPEEEIEDNVLKEAEEEPSDLADTLGHDKRTLIDDYENTDKDERPYSVVRMADDSRPVSGQPCSPRSSFVTQMMKKELTEADLDPEFVLVQILTKGQAFGIQQLFLEDQPELFLVSAGAECVMLNKKIYKDLVNTNMAQNIKQHLSPYPSDEVLQENLQTRVNWLQYRKVTIKGLHDEQKGSLAYRPSTTKGRNFKFGKT